MTRSEAEKLVPKEFRIACHTIKVVIDDKGDSYGCYDSLRNTIHLNLEVGDDDHQYVAQSKEQFMNTYYHELVHVFQFFFNTDMDEALAQSFSNMICEYLETKINN